MPLALSRSAALSSTADVTAASPAAPPAAPPIQETDLDRVLKLVPTEILTFYTAAVPLTSEVTWSYFPFVLFVFGLAMVPLVLFLDGKSTKQPAQWPQYLVRCLAFVAWANAISWPFSPWVDGHSVDVIRSFAVLVVPLIGGLVLRERTPTAT